MSRALLLLTLGLLPVSAFAEPISYADTDSIPASVDIDGVSVTLQVSIWKDLMPRVTTPGTVVRRPGYQLRIVLNAGASRMSPDPARPRVVVRPERLWVIRGKEVWEGAFSQAERIGSEEYAIRNGPPWPAGGAVDVVVRFVDAAGKVHAIKSAGVPVEAVY